MADIDDIAKAIRDLTGKRVLVGIPAEKDARPGDPVGNALIGYVQNYGSPARNIPARPFLEPGIEAAMRDLTPHLEAAARAALDGDSASVDQHLGKAGQTAVNSVQATIQAGIPPPLKDATVRRRRIRTPGSSYRRRATSAADTTPLIDTGALLRSITYVIRKR